MCDLTIYPLKSGRGISVNQAQATTHGLAVNKLQDRSVISMKMCHVHGLLIVFLVDDLQLS